MFAVAFGSGLTCVTVLEALASFRYLQTDHSGYSIHSNNLKPAPEDT
jgi:hypothetical protein